MVAADDTLQVTGCAFFPVGRGLWEDGDTSLSNKKVMVLGQDFGTVQDVREKVLPQGKESVTGNPTWRNLISVLQSAGIREEDCFFTNAIMGLRLDGKNTDTPSAFKHPAFLAACRAFFIEQLKAQKPKVILTLGFWPIHFLREGLSAKLTRRWGAFKKITPIVSAEEHSVIREVVFEAIPDYKTNIVALIHPSLRGVNWAKLSKQTHLNVNNDTESARIRSILSQ